MQVWREVAGCCNWAVMRGPQFVSLLKNVIIESISRNYIKSFRALYNHLNIANFASIIYVLCNAAK